MASVGEQLRAAREKQGLSIADIAERTKLRCDQVQAIEDGDYHVFAARVYVRGIVRSYATLLRLQPAPVLADLDAELEHSERLQDSAQLTKRMPSLVDWLMLQLSKVKWGPTLLVVGLALALYLSIAGYRAWRTHQSRDPLADLGPGLYQSTDTNVGELLPLAPPSR
jgi:cytoskeleton protein RodZ